MATRVLTTDGTFSTGTWYRVEAANYSVNSPSNTLTNAAVAVDDTNTARNIPVTFTTAGNQKGIVLFMTRWASPSGNFSIKLQELVGAVWTDRTTDTWTVDTTNFPGSRLSKYFALTSYAVTNAASTWRYQVYCDASAKISITRDATASNWYYQVALDANTDAPSSGDVITIADGKTFTQDASISLGVAGSHSIILCEGANFACAPTASWTLTLLGCVSKSDNGTFKVGSSGSPVSVANRYTLDCSGLASTVFLFMTSSSFAGSGSSGFAYEFYGAENDNLYVEVASEANSGQKNIVVDRDMSATLSAGDKFVTYGKVSGTMEYTIDTISGTTITTTVNLDAEILQGGRLVFFNERDNLGIYIKGHSKGWTGMGFNGYCSYGYFKFSGVYFENIAPTFGGNSQVPNVYLNATGGKTNSGETDLLRSCLIDTRLNLDKFTTPSSDGIVVSNVHDYETAARYASIFTCFGKNATASNLTFRASSQGRSMYFYGNNNTYTGVKGIGGTTSSLACYFEGGGLTFTNCNFFNGFPLYLKVNASTLNSVEAQNGTSYNLELLSSVDVTMNSCNFGGRAVAGTNDVYVDSNEFVKITMNETTVGANGIGNMANAITESFISEYNTSGLQKTYTPEGVYELQDTVFSTLKRAWKITPTITATLPVKIKTTVQGFSGQLLTVTAKLRKNASYGSSTRPYLKISGIGMATSTGTMTDSTDTFEVVTASGTPTENGFADIEVGSQSANSGALAYLDDIKPTIAPISTGVLESGYKGKLAPLVFTTGVTAQGDWTDDPYVSADEATSLARTGITLNKTALTLAITTAYTISELYEFIKAECRDDEVPNIYLTTVDGTNWTTNCDVTITGVALTGTGTLNLSTQSIIMPTGSTTLTLTNGTLVLGTAGTINTALGTMTVDYQDTGTFDHRGADISGVVSVDTTTEDTVTAQFAPGTSVTNLDETNITVESSASVVVTVEGLVVGSQVRVTETVSGDELLNVTADATSEAFNYTYSTDIGITVRVRKGSTATKYIEWNGSGTIGSTGVTVTANLTEDTYANATTHANWAEWTIDGSAKTITHSSGSTIFTTNELYTGLQDWADAEGNMQYVNPMACNVKDQSYTMGVGWTLAADSEQYLKTGGLQTSDAGVIYTNLYTTDTLVADSEVYIVQNGTEITAWWSGNPIDILVKVKTGGSLIDSGNLEYFVRKYGTLFDYQLVDASGGGRMVVVMANFTDSNNTTASATVAGYSDISVTIADGDYDIGDGDGDQPYNGVVDGAGRTVAQVYEYLKYITRDGSTFDMDGVEGQYFRYLDAAYGESETAPIATKAGDVIFFAQGWFFTDMASGDALNYQLIDENGVTRNPPTPPTTISITNIVDGSRLQIFNVTTDEELFNDIITGTTKDYTYTPGAGDETIRIRLTSVGAASAYLFYEANITANDSGGSLVAAQVEDTVYAENGVDGSGITSCSVTGTTIKVYIDEATNAIDIQDIYNWYCYMLFTESGIRDQGWNLRAVDSVNYKTYNSLLIHNDGGDPLLLGGGYILPSAGGTVLDIYDTTGDPIFLGYNHAVGLAGGSGGATAAQVWGYATRTLSSAERIKYIDSGEQPIY